MKCFDITFNGYAEVWANHQLFDHDLVMQADNLCKWISAPSIEIVQRFLDSQGLTEHLSGPPQDMQEDHYTHDHGVDVILDENAQIVSLSCYFGQDDFRDVCLQEIALVVESIKNVTEAAGI